MAHRKPAPTFTCEFCGAVVEVRRYFVTKALGRKQVGHSAGFRAPERFCSPQCQWESQKTGPFIDKHGYRILKIDGKQVPEHRAVMETMLGRPLLRHETVHHKNGQRADNRPENLELFDSRHPKGQRVEDKIDWAILYLEEHGFSVSARGYDARLVERPCGVMEG